jgi:hypothetical protein
VELLGALAVLIVGVAIVAHAAGGGDGIYGRFVGPIRRAGRLGGPLGNQPPRPDEQCRKPPNENDLL